VKNDTIFAGTGRGIFYSANFGAKWNASNSVLDVQSLIVYGNTILAGTYGGAGTGAGIFMTKNNGDSWTQVHSPGLKKMMLSKNNIYIISAGVYLSSDLGKNWQNISGNLGQYVDIFYCLAILDNTIFAGSNRYGIFKSDDNGTTWRSANIGIREDPSGKMILSLFSKGSVIYAGTGAGVYKSYDKGENWLPENIGLPIEGIQNLGVIDSFLFAGTIGDGLWKLTFRDTIGVNETTDVQTISNKKLTRLNVYPNPAEDNITINFDDPSDEEYALEVLNIAGVVLYKTQVNRTLNKISLEGLNYHGFCILKITDTTGKIRAVQKIMKL
jgi:hypothetical protein